MTVYTTPGVYREEVLTPPPSLELRTGVPAFLGLVAGGPAGPRRLQGWDDFRSLYGVVETGYLAAALRGFFANGGELCYLQPLSDLGDAALGQALDGLAVLSDFDLLCAPDLASDGPVLAERQRRLIDWCGARGDVFALLDPPRGRDWAGVLDHRQGLDCADAALYYPWLMTDDGLWVPPSGHVAGIYARSDRRVGVHKAPANEALEGVLDLETVVDDRIQGGLNPQGVNCLRAFPGRGIRVWGARTLASEEAWVYINVRRVFITVGRWIEHNLAGLTFEPHDARLWARIVRELGVYLRALHDRGALQGRTRDEAFYIKCDAETNPPEVRDAGRVVTEIGLAASKPNELIVVRIHHGASGISISGPGKAQT